MGTQIDEKTNFSDATISLYFPSREILEEDFISAGVAIDQKIKEDIDGRWHDTQMIYLASLISAIKSINDVYADLKNNLLQQIADWLKSTDSQHLLDELSSLVG